MIEENSNFDFFDRLNIMYGFKLYDEVAYASVNGFAYSLSKNKSKHYELVTSVNFNDRNKRNAILLCLKELFDELKTDNTISDNHYISIVFHSKNLDEQFLNRIGFILQKFENVFIANEIVPSCWRCNKEGRYTQYSRSNMIQELCDDCITKLKSEQHNEIQKNQSKSYYVGIFGSLIGSIGASVCWIILYYMNLSYFIIAIIFGLLPLYGYMKLNGKNSKGMFWILLFSIVTSVVASQILVVSLDIYFENLSYLTFIDAIGYGISSLYDTRNFYVDRVWFEILRLSMIGIVAGIGPIFVYIRKDFGSKTKSFTQINIE